MNLKSCSLNLLVDSEIFEKDSIAAFKLLETIKTNNISSLFTENLRFLKEFAMEDGLKLIPIYHVLRNNPEFSQNLDLAQTDYKGNVISPYFCPNNPKVYKLIKKVFESYDKSYTIAGIQMDGLELPSFSLYLGCFCKYCSQLAEENGIDITTISEKFYNGRSNNHDGDWIRKKFQEWIKFRNKSVYNLAGRLMIALRKVNPALSLGLNIKFSKYPDLIGQDYFFLALFLDILNFNTAVLLDKVEKKLLKQIRSTSKKFLGDIQLNLQVKVPESFNEKQARKLINKMEHFSFDGLVFQASTLRELEKIVTI